MHRRLVPRSLFCRSAVAAIGLSLALAASGHAADLSKDVTSAADATPFQGTIHASIESRVRDIVADDPSKAMRARESLVDELRGTPSASFSDVYCGELANLLMPLARNPSPRVRLNAAIITARVAERAADASARLAPLIIAQLKDENMGVVLWAMRAAHFVLPPVVNLQGKTNTIIPAMVAAAEHSNSGAVVGAAYDALTADTSNATALPIYLDAVQKLLAFRISQYASGTAPSEPPMDTRATVFLTDRKVWTLQGKTLQPTTVQMIVDLIGAGGPEFGSVQGTDRQELAALLSFAAKALYVIGITNNDQGLITAVAPLSSTQGNTPPATVMTNVAGAITAAITSFPTVHKPAAPSSAPATAPSTSAAQ
ncbi:MAG: hypothetical protein JO353_04060 [Phycisphaerae bacterium]|nr:hypothetical protein [Phycisphaerae bacterium]